GVTSDLWLGDGEEKYTFSRVEGQSLTVECRYNAASYREQRKDWCQLRDAICSPLVITPLTSPRRDLKTATSGRTTIVDYTRNGIVTITMQNLQVQDSGVYSCGRYDPRNTFYPLKTIKLDVSKGDWILLITFCVFQLSKNTVLWRDRLYL
uniref:Ig-like domain-containing protein n=1 Tax=Pelusios castaneus TaxID=367368 RepID=A0A8C8S171_9SAUR